MRNMEVTLRSYYTLAHSLTLPYLAGKTGTTLLGEEEAHGHSRRSGVRGTSEIQEVVVLVGLCIARRRGIEAWAAGGGRGEGDGGQPRNSPPLIVDRVFASPSKQIMALSALVLSTLM